MTGKYLSKVTGYILYYLLRLTSSCYYSNRSYGDGAAGDGLPHPPYIYFLLSHVKRKSVFRNIFDETSKFFRCIRSR